MFSTSFLLASLVWGSVGTGYFIYGKKQRSWPPMLGGVLVVLVSYFVGSALGMTLACAGLITGIHVLLRQGY